MSKPDWAHVADLLDEIVHEITGQCPRTLKDLEIHARDTGPSWQCAIVASGGVENAKTQTDESESEPEELSPRSTH